MHQKRRGSVGKGTIHSRAIESSLRQFAEGVALSKRLRVSELSLRKASGEAPQSEKTFPERVDSAGKLVHQFYAPKAKPSRAPSVASQRSSEQQRPSQELEKNETAFFQGLIELQYGRNVERKLRSIAKNIPWARGWPAEKQAFWNAEAFMWQRKIDKKQRQAIEREIGQEVALLAGKRTEKRNLDLGCGAYSYLHSTAGVDLSARMLAFNERIEQKVQLDLEHLTPGLPFPTAAFDSVTAVFLLNYLPEHTHAPLFREIRRVLKKGGLFVMVLAAQPLEQRYGRQERATLSCGQWKRKLQPFFKVKAYEQEKKWFFCCRKWF